MRVVYRPEAIEELEESKVWYEERHRGLGFEFLRCVRAAVARVQRWPESCPKVRDEIRRCTLRRFPYIVLYRIDEDTLVVLAVHHTRRDPARWHQRQ